MKIKRLNYKTSRENLSVKLKHLVFQITIINTFPFSLSHMITDNKTLMINNDNNTNIVFLFVM